MRPPRVVHSTPEPYRFFGRQRELAILDEALDGGTAGVVALVGPGGQGKTAIARQWLQQVASRTQPVDGVYLWSFYRGKDADRCLRDWYAYAAGVAVPGDVSASWCVDHLLDVLRQERWAVVLDGTEVAQYEEGPWRGRFLHPELGRFLEELASEPMPGVVVLTTRFGLPTLLRRPGARVLTLDGLDPASARDLLVGLGVHGETTDLDKAAAIAGHHAKAVELLGTFLVRYHHGDARRCDQVREVSLDAAAGPEEHCVARVLAAFRAGLSPPLQDILALATAFREPPTEDHLLDYLASAPARSLLHQTWGRHYVPFAAQPGGWLAARLQELIELRLLERVGAAEAATTHDDRVIDAHPLVRREFEAVRGPGGRREGAAARAGFLRGRPDRRRAETLEEARGEIELFHAWCEAGLWQEADATFAALDNPKHRFLAAALERDLLSHFFPGGDWHRPPLWRGFHRHRSLAIALEMLGQFEEALAVYPAADAALRGDALLALGQLGPLLTQSRATAPWQTLWQSYRCHALVLAGQSTMAWELVRGLVPVDIYEWVHVFECLLRLDRLDALDLRSVLFRPPGTEEHRWAGLARRRMRADYIRLRGQSKGEAIELGREYAELADAYDRGGLPQERALTRLSWSRWLLDAGHNAEAQSVATAARTLAQRHGLRIIEADACDLLGQTAARHRLRREAGYTGPARP